jgi:hypothetical protein
MGKEPEQLIEPEENLSLSARLDIMDALISGDDSEYVPMRHKLYEEGLGGHVGDCLNEMKDTEFDRLCYLLGDLRLLIAREEAINATIEAETPVERTSNEINSFEQLDHLISKRRKINYSTYKMFKEHVNDSFENILMKAQKEGTNGRRKRIALRMRRLGFPLHTILRVTEHFPDMPV